MPTLELTLQIGCGLNCTFCPQDKLSKAYPADAPRRLAIDKLGEVLDKLPPHVRVDFSGMTEPWLHPHATEMLLMTLQDGYNVAIYTTLAGMRRPREAEEVAKYLVTHAGQVENLTIHLPDASNNMPGWNWTPQWQHCLDVFVELEQMAVLPAVEIMTMNGLGQVHPDVMHNLRVPPWLGNARAGNIPNQGPIVFSKENEGSLSCSYTPHYDQNVLLPNGDVYLCCMDYSLKHKIGNLFEQDYYSMFRSEGMAILRAENAKEYGCGSLCRTCSRATVYTTHSNARQFWDEVKEQPHRRGQDETNSRRNRARHSQRG